MIIIPTSTEKCITVNWFDATLLPFDLMYSHSIKLVLFTDQGSSPCTRQNTRTHETKNADIRTSMPRVDFELTIPVFELSQGHTCLRPRGYWDWHQNFTRISLILLLLVSMNPIEETPFIQSSKSRVNFPLRNCYPHIHYVENKKTVSLKSLNRCGVAVVQSV